MAIKNARYSDDQGTVAAEIDGVVMYVPADPMNRHYQEVKAWEDAGGVIAPFVAAASPDLTKKQKVEAMLARSGLTVDDLKSALSEK